MWKIIPNTHYFLCSTNKLELFITDFITIWFHNFSAASFLTCLKESNFVLDSIDDNELIEKGKRMLSNPDELKKFSFSDDFIISMTMSYEFPLKLNVKVTEGTKELFFQKVTQQLLRTIHDLRTSQQELRHLLQKKDKEIEEYKCEGGEIALRHLKTKPYNDEAHMSKHTVYEDYFGSPDVPNDLLAKAVAVPNVDVKQEPKQEPKPDVKSEPEVHIQAEPIKIEPQCGTQSSSVSPKKRLKRKLNI